MGNFLEIMSAATCLSQADVQSEVDKVLAIRADAERQWSEGKRDFVRLEVFALAGSLNAMFEALRADDPRAYLKAAKEARDYAGRAHVHGSIWLKKAPSP